MNLGGDLGQIYSLLFQELKNVLVRPIYGLLKIAILALSRFSPRKWSKIEMPQKSSLVGSRVYLSAEIEFRSHFWPRKVVLGRFWKNNFLGPREPPG